MYTILARIKKDREKIRIFCCDALYCLGLNAIIILYTVFTCWPEVFRQNNDINTGAYNFLNNFRIKFFIQYFLICY